MSKLAHMTIQRVTGGNVPSWELQDRIARARRYAGLEQAELAEKAGLSRKSISNYEIGKTSPRRSGLIAIAFATGVSLEWLETGNAPIDPGTNGGSEWGHRGLNPGPMDYRPHKWRHAAARVA